MSALATAIAERGGAALWLVRARDRLLFVSVLASFLVMIEPSPNEVIAAVGLSFLLATGPTFPRQALPLVWLVIGLNLSGAFAALPVIDRDKVPTFVGISVFMGAYALYFTALFSENILHRLRLMERAWIIAAVIASGAGIAGYFDIAGTHDLFTLYGSRAKGTFNDPNVFGPYLILPLMLLIQGFMLGDRRRAILRGAALAVIGLGLFLSFSRGAWGHAVASVGLMVGLSFITTRSPRLRVRILLLLAASLVCLAAALTVLLALPDIRDVFLGRATLAQDYDVRRFTNYLNALDIILDNINGIGPFEFNARFGEDPHNAYIHTFVAYGWVGGLCYLALVATTLMLAWRSVWVTSPYQRWLIPIVSTYTGVAGLSFIIHSDHWRHYFLLTGVVWALSAATESWRRQAAAARLSTQP